MHPAASLTEILTSSKAASRAVIVVVALVSGFAPVAMGETVNFKCETSQASSQSQSQNQNQNQSPGGGQDPALLQIQGGDLISSPRVMFGQPSFEPILSAAPGEFTSAVANSEFAKTAVANKLNQFAVATTSTGNLWSSRRSEIYVDKKLLSLEEGQGNVVVVSKQSSMIRSGGPSTVVVYSCTHL